MNARLEPARGASGLVAWTIPATHTAGVTLAGLLVAEMVAMTIWFDTQTLRPRSGLVWLVAESGPTVLRCAVAAAVIAVALRSLFWSDAQTASAQIVATGGVSLRWLAAHFVLAILFATISFSLFGGQVAAAFDNLRAAAWLVVGAGATIAAVFALFPPRACTDAFGAHWRAIAVVLTVAAAVCMFGWLSLVLWQPMSRGTLAVAFAMLHPFVPAATSDAATFSIGTPEFSVLVSRECSGAEGLGLMLVFTCAWLWVHRAERRFPQALLLVPVGLSLVWLFNCARIAALVFIGVAGAPGVAIGGFHSQAGWLGFNAVAIGTCLATQNVPWLTAAGGKRVPASEAASNPTAIFLMPFLVLLAAAMISGLGTDTFEWLYPLRVVALVAVLWHFRHGYRELDWRVGPTAIVLGLVVFAVWVGLDPLAHSRSQMAMPAPLAAAPQGVRIGWLALRIIGAVVTVPIAEELAFRGFLLRRLVATDFEGVSASRITTVAIVISSIGFGLLHGQHWLAGTLAGLAYTAAYLRRGSIGDATAAHATTNALIAVAVLGGGQWQLW